MTRIRGRGGYKPQIYNKTEVLQWLKTIPLAPEFYPTIEEFQDPISYIHKIEEQASLFGICKIIPPVSLPSRKNTILELNKSLLACSASPEGKLKPTFTTRVQQVGSCRRKNHPVIKSVRESGKTYTFSEFEAKAKSVEKNYLKKCSIDKHILSPLQIETIYWNANADKPIEVEYANDLVGSAFVELDRRRGREGLSEDVNVGESKWNLRGTARSEGCPLKFVKDDVPGVTSPMIYMGMMFSWFAWHVEDHDLHSLNYMHTGDGKTWYGVPSKAAIAFEEVVRNHGYGGQMNPILTYATLAKKTTIMSPEVILNAGIPCCRLVQNAGEFVVTFPRAYHSGFSHGFNCAEASNIATPEWLKFAREAAIRRAATNYPPLVSHIQLLYDHALSFSSSVSMSIEPRGLRLEEKKKGEEECLVKELFVKDLMHTTDLLHRLGKGTPAILLPCDFIENQINTTLYPCVACGDLCFASAAIIKPSEVAAHNRMSADSGNIGGRMAARSCVRSPEDTSSLALIALAYGDATDSETESRDVSPVYSLDNDDCRSSHSTSFSVVSPTESTNSQSSGGSSITGMVCPNVPVQNRDNLFAPNSDEDSSRLHVFCLQHAFEVEQRLCAFGGVHILLLCHPDYPKFLAEAKVMANKLGADHILSDISFRPSTEEDEEIIKSALISQGSIYGDADWAAKLGVNLFYSANLGHSPLYSKQIPYNRVMYNAFGLGSSADIRAIPDALKRRSLADIELASRGKSPELEESVKVTADAPKHKDFIQYKRTFKNKQKRQKMIQEETPRPERHQAQGEKQFDVNFNTRPEEGGPSTRLRPRIGKQPAKLECTKRAKRTPVIQASAFERAMKSKDIEYTCNAEGCTMNFGSKQELVQHEKNICPVKGCLKKFVSHKYLLHHQKVHLDDRPLKCTWAGCTKTFKWEWARTEHTRIHTGDRPYICGETGCEKTFRFVSDFSRHKRNTGHSRKLENQ